MLDGLRLYGRYIDISFRSQMQYRASFVMLSVGHGLMTGLEFLGDLGALRPLCCPSTLGACPKWPSFTA